MTTPVREIPAISLDDAAAREWDVAVVGAGPAGAMAARQIARCGVGVLLIDKEQFPRRKVCGCCLNAAALELLSDCGLPDVPGRFAAPPLTRVRLGTAGRTVVLPVPRGLAVSREALDTWLVRAAVQEGAKFLPQTAAQIGDATDGVRRVKLTRAGRELFISARVVIVADGVSGRTLRNCRESKTVIAPDSRVGGNAVLADAAPEYPPGIIHMACAAGGYVGLVRLEDARLDIAVAVDVGFVQHRAGLGRCAQQILAEAGFTPVIGLESANWHGTPRLTFRRTPIAFDRVFVAGDAARYVEPFTGEGMAWALATGAAVAPFALSALGAWHPALARRWEVEYSRILSARQRRCRLVTRLIRQPLARWAIVSGLAVLPGLARPVLAAINRPLLDRV